MPHENYFNVKSATQRKVRSYEYDDYSNNQMGFEKLTIFLAQLVGNNKTIHSPTSRHCYFYSLELCPRSKFARANFDPRVNSR